LGRIVTAEKLRFRCWINEIMKRSEKVSKVGQIAVTQKATG